MELSKLFFKISNIFKIPEEKLIVSKRNVGSSDKHILILNEESR
jgi:hypothetical protein